MESKLKNTLKINALFSFTGSMVLLLFSDQLGTLFNAAQPGVLTYIGIGLAFFASYVAICAFRPTLSKNYVFSIILQDWAWVIASGCVILFKIFNLSATGYFIIGLVAIAVALFAVFQYKYLKTLTFVMKQG